jgi:hypothetical protein
MISIEDLELRHQLELWDTAVSSRQALFNCIFTMLHIYANSCKFSCCISSRSNFINFDNLIFTLYSDKSGSFQYKCKQEKYIGTNLYSVEN